MMHKIHCTDCSSLRKCQIIHQTGLKVTRVFELYSCTFFETLWMWSTTNTVYNSITSIETLFDSTRLHQGLHNMWRNKLVSLENRSPRSIRPISYIGCIRLSSKCFVYSNSEQRNEHPKHIQAILFEVGLQGYVLERVWWFMPAREVRINCMTNKSFITSNY